MSRPLLRLQRQIGNRAAARLLSRKPGYQSFEEFERQMLADGPAPASAAYSTLPDDWDALPAPASGSAAPPAKAPYSYVVAADEPAPPAAAAAAAPAEKAPYTYTVQPDEPAAPSRYAAVRDAPPPSRYAAAPAGPAPVAAPPPAAVAAPSEDAIAPAGAAGGRWATKQMVHDPAEARTNLGFTKRLTEVAGGLLHDLVRHGILPKGSKVKDIKPAIFAMGVKRLWGWSDEDVARYKGLLGEAGMSVDPSLAGSRWKVDYIEDASRRESYAVKPGATWTNADGTMFDTSRMTSKASGPGFAIFVMDRDGRVYAGAHKVGLFHHSSFLAGGEAAAAGELKVTAGKLKEVTAKSGHYMPTPGHTRAFLEQLHQAGANLRGVVVKVWREKPGKPQPTTWIYDAEEFRVKGVQARGKDTGQIF